MNTDIITNIKARRKELYINQKEFGKLIGLTQRTVSRYEDISYYDDLSPQKIKRLTDICEYLNIPFKYDGPLKSRSKRNPPTIFGEKVEDVTSILFFGVWITSDSRNSLEFFHDPFDKKYYFSFWLNDNNRIGDAERITGEISAIQAVAAS